MNHSIRLFPVVFYLFSMASAESLASVSVHQVEFDRVDGAVGRSEWLECSIELEVRRDASDPSRLRPDYIDDLSVELMLGFESTVRGKSGFEFFKSEASLVSLKEGRHVVRFYLPPEVVERDRIGREAHSFLIRLHRSGSIVREFVSRQLERDPVKNSFLKRVDAESNRNNGILLPQFKTPFRAAYSRETPSYRDDPAKGEKEG